MEHVAKTRPRGGAEKSRPSIGEPLRSSVHAVTHDGVLPEAKVLRWEGAGSPAGAVGRILTREAQH